MDEELVHKVLQAVVVRDQLLLEFGETSINLLSTSHSKCTLWTYSKGSGAGREPKEEI